MKKVIIVLIFSLIFQIKPFAQDLKIFSTPQIREPAKDISFADSLTGWMVCNKGVIYKTTDGAKTWTEQNSGITSDFSKVFFLDVNTGWAATLNGTVVKTTDGGESWTSTSFSKAVPNVIFSLCDMIKFVDQNTGFIIAGKLLRIYILKTTDGGVNWNVKDSLVSTTTKRWYDLDLWENNGVVVGDKKDIQKYTTDGGETWKSTTINDNFFYWLKYVKFLSPTEVIAIGEGNEFNGVILPVYKSTDAGVTWTKKSQSFTTVYDRVKDAYFKNNLEGIGVGSDGFSKAFITKTSDGGETWITNVLDYAFGFQAICGVNGKVFLLGTSGQVVVSTDMGTSWSISPQKTTSSIINFAFVDQNILALSRNGDILINADGTGLSWDYLSNVGKNLSGAMVVTTNKNVFVLKENHHIGKSTDIGKTWKTVLEPVKPYSRNLVGGIAFGDDYNGYAWFSQNDYGEYHVYKTSDEGETWNEAISFPGPGYISGNVIAFDSQTAVLLGPDLWTERTTDGGVSWNPTTLIDFPNTFSLKDFEDVVKIDSTRAMAIGDRFICTTSDKGETWTYLNHGLNDIDSGFYKITFSGDSLGYISLYSGVILKTTDFGNSWSKDSTYNEVYYFFAAGMNAKGQTFWGTSTGYILGEEPIIDNVLESKPNTFEIFPNFPNPFNPSTSVLYRLDHPSHVEINIFNVLGEKVLILADDFQTEGLHRLVFNSASGTSRLATGIYLIHFKIDNNSFILKTVLMK